MIPRAKIRLGYHFLPRTKIPEIRLYYRLYPGLDYHQSLNPYPYYYEILKYYEYMVMAIEEDRLATPLPQYRGYF